ncbi:MAG TPA: GYD domain-containing protein [Nitrososphaeraceae archaeon]|nr:GYD domain-containing protein [Nitrososphaeraceae archaeon]
MFFENKLSFYIVLWNFTEQGIKSLKDCLRNIVIFKTNVERRGHPYHGTFYPAGQYDAASLIEADDDNAVKECVLQAEEQVNVRSTTLKPISKEEGLEFEDTIRELFRVID